MSDRTINLDQGDLTAGVAALASASQAFQLTRFERFSYQALMVTVYLAVASLVAIILLIAFLWAWLGHQYPISFVMLDLADVVAVLLLPFLVFGLVSLALNIPLLLKASRERARLKALGLGSLSESILLEHRRRRWIRRIPRAVLRVSGICLLVLAVFLLLRNKLHGRGWLITSSEINPALFLALMAILLFSGRYLSDQRARMGVAASAEELKKALQNLRRRTGEEGVVAVPAALLEQGAEIESAQIAQERKDAILQSVASRQSGYAITFDRDAAEQRATLAAEDRVEVEDLVAQLSTEGEQLERRGAAIVGVDGATLRGASVEMEYTTDRASRGIRITAVRRRGDGAATP
jgi:hypothetical protein